MYTAKVTSKGQVTLPAEMRRKLGLRPGDYLEIRETPAGYTVRKLVQASPFDRYVGVLGHKANPDTNPDTDILIEEMRGPR